MSLQNVAAAAFFTPQFNLPATVASVLYPCMYTPTNDRTARRFSGSLVITYIVPFHKFVALSQALGHAHRLELQRMNSRLCPCHWLIHASQTRGWNWNESASSRLLLFMVLSFVPRSETGWSPLLLPVCHAHIDGGGGASRLWRGCGGGRRRSGLWPPTAWLTERHAASAKTRRERERERRGEEGEEWDLNELHVWFQIVQVQRGDRVAARTDLAPPCVRGNRMATRGLNGFLQIRLDSLTLLKLFGRCERGTPTIKLCFHRNKHSF